MLKLPINKIKIRNRYRKNLGDVRSLANSIAELGLLHPIVVKSDNRLIAGERRLAACKLLGLKTVPVTIIDIDRIVRGEFAENAYRKDFLPSEVDAIRRALEPIEQAAARKRMSNGGKGVETCHTSQGKTRDKIGAVAGLSGRTIEKIAAIMEAARRDLKRFAPLVAAMDKTGKVDGPYRTLRQWLDADTRQSIRPPQGKFRTLVVDCPWDLPGKHRARPDYATMSLPELEKLPIPKWADRQGHLYLWSNNATLPQAIELIEHWGFQLKTVLTWIKQPGLGLGTYFRNTTEQVLFATTGT